MRNVSLLKYLVYKRACEIVSCISLGLLGNWINGSSTHFSDSFHRVRSWSHSRDIVDKIDEVCIRIDVSLYRFLLWNVICHMRCDRSSRNFPFLCCRSLSHRIFKLSQTVLLKLIHRVNSSMSISIGKWMIVISSLVIDFLFFKIWGTDYPFFGLLVNLRWWSFSRSMIAWTLLWIVVNVFVLVFSQKFLSF